MNYIDLISCSIISSAATDGAGTDHKQTDKEIKDDIDPASLRHHQLISSRHTLALPTPLTLLTLLALRQNL